MKRIQDPSQALQPERTRIAPGVGDRGYPFEVIRGRSQAYVSRISKRYQQALQEVINLNELAKEEALTFILNDTSGFDSTARCQYHFGLGIVNPFR